jgi:AcrR family transcriptional regulator
MSSDLSHMGASRGRQREFRREQLLEVAARLFAQRGLEGTTTKDIAREAGVSAGLLYHYYPSKEDLLVAVVSHFDALSRLRPLLDGHLEGSASEVLMRMLRGISTFMEEHRDVMWLCMRAAGRFPTVAQALRQTREQMTELLASFLQGRIDRGEFMPHDTVRVARGLYNVLAMEHLEKAPGRSDVEPMVEALLYGLVPRT